jgi:cytoskeletal protein CcmA (bactofilin family)
MFKDLYAKEGEVETIIGPSVKVEGDFASKGNVTVEGAVYGTIKTDKDLKVGSAAKISANIIAANAFVSGEVKGNVKVNGKLELSDTSRIFGDVEAKTLIMAAGAVLNGKCSMCQETAQLPLSGDQGVNGLNFKKINKK